MSSYVKTVGDLSVPDEEQVETAAETSFDPVTKLSNNAAHTGIDCKAAMESMLGTEAYVSHMQGCAFEYLWSWREKNGIQDLKEARECIENMLEALEGCAS